MTLGCFIVATAQRVLYFIDHAPHGLAAKLSDHLVGSNVQCLFVDPWRFPTTVELHHPPIPAPPAIDMVPAIHTFTTVCIAATAYSNI
jgi:hypothetical protein